MPISIYTQILSCLHDAGLHTSRNSLSSKLVTDHFMSFIFPLYITQFFLYGFLCQLRGVDEKSKAGIRSNPLGERVGCVHFLHAKSCPGPREKPQRSLEFNSKAPSRGQWTLKTGAFDPADSLGGANPPLLQSAGRGRARRAAWSCLAG